MLCCVVLHVALCEQHTPLLGLTHLRPLRAMSKRRKVELAKTANVLSVSVEMLLLLSTIAFRFFTCARPAGIVASRI